MQILNGSFGPSASNARLVFVTKPTAKTVCARRYTVHDTRYTVRDLSGSLEYADVSFRARVSIARSYAFDHTIRRFRSVAVSFGVPWSTEKKVCANHVVISSDWPPRRTGLFICPRFRSLNVRWISRTLNTSERIESRNEEFAPAQGGTAPLSMPAGFPQT